MQRHTPFGYRIIDGKAEIMPETAKVVRAVFQEYLTGIATRQIAKNLTEQGVLNASHKLSWNHGSVGKILENRKYTGDEFYPPLIDTEIFEQVQCRREEQVKKLGRYVQPNSFRNQTLLGGKLYCGVCGQPYRRYVEQCDKPGENIKWKCKHYIKEKRVCCRNIFLTDAVIENAFVSIINRIIAEPDMLEPKPRIKMSLPCPACEKLTLQIQTAFETGQYTAEEIKRLAFDRAREQYRSAIINDTGYQTDKLRIAVSGREVQAKFEEKLFQQTVRKIMAQPEGKLQFELRNGLILDISISEIQQKGENTTCKQ